MAVKYRMDEPWLIHPGQISPALVQHVTPEIALSNIELNTAIALCAMLTVNTKLETAKDYLSQFWIGEQKWKKVESHWHQQYQDKRKCQCCRCGLNGPQNAKTQQLYECEQIHLPQSNLIKQNTTSAQSVLSDN